mgnify:CR=1 FL=1
MIMLFSEKLKYFQPAYRETIIPTQKKLKRDKFFSYYEFFAKMFCHFQVQSLRESMEPALYTRNVRDVGGGGGDLMQSKPHPFFFWPTPPGYTIWKIGHILSIFCQLILFSPFSPRSPFFPSLFPLSYPLRGGGGGNPPLPPPLKMHLCTVQSACM